MAEKILKDNFMGTELDTYNRIASTGGFVNGIKRITTVNQKFSGEEYRRENPNDFKPYNEEIELTDEEYNDIWNILYTAKARKSGGIKC